MTAELSEQSETAYVWRVNILSLHDGRRLSYVDLSKLHPGTDYRALHWHSERSLSVAAPDGTHYALAIE